ncbi:MAG: hypothetical protein EBR01_01770 [Proteobacteria bacterium]|nr:hypothetical protein [Pseudomonadota bacterium]
MKRTSVLLVWASICVRGVLATPTGINNIPTADVVPHRKVAIQHFGSFGPGNNQFAANGAGNSSLWMGQTKANFSPWENGMVALGIANIALTDFDRAGHPFSYGILAQDFGYVRAHAGYGLQLNANTALFGIDRNFKIFKRTLNLNIDLVQAADHSFWLPAAGFKYDPTDYIVLESWANFPGRGRSSYIAKVNLVFGV